MSNIKAKLRYLKETMIKRSVYGILLLLVSIISFFIFGEHGIIVWCMSAVFLLASLLFFYKAFVSCLEIKRVNNVLVRRSKISNTYNKN